VTGDTTVQSFGPGGDSVFGQTLTATATENVLNRFTFTSISSVNNLSFNYQTYIYAYNTGTNMETGAALYTSGVMTVPATGTVMD
jgi:hypothetical protein